MSITAFHPQSCVHIWLVWLVITPGILPSVMAAMPLFVRCLVFCIVLASLCSALNHVLCNDSNFVSHWHNLLYRGTAHPCFIVAQYADAMDCALILSSLQSFSWNWNVTWRYGPGLIPSEGSGCPFHGRESGHTSPPPAERLSNRGKG